MENNIKSVQFHLIADVFIFIICIFGIINYWQKADVPFQIAEEQNNLILISNSSKNQILSNDQKIVSIDGIRFNSREQLEVYLDGKSINDTVSIEINSNGNQNILSVELVKFYSYIYDFVALFVGLIFFSTGIFVLIRGKEKKIALIFHWCMVTTAMIILMTWGNFKNLGLFIGILTRTGFHFGYAFIPSVFLHFSFMFPFTNKSSFKNLLKVTYSLSITFAVSLSAIFIFYANNISLSEIEIYLKLYDICSVFVIAVILYAIYIQLKNYNSTRLLSDRKKLRWIMLGYFIGPITYLFLWVIPQRFTSEGLIPEELVLLLISAVPITFGIAILKYHIMDTEIIIRRTIVYPITILILILIYISIFTLFLDLFNLPQSNLTSVTSAIIIALLFHPIKENVKLFVNKKIFKVEYDYRTALNSFLFELKEINNINELTKKIIELLNELMPVEKAGFFSFNHSLNELSLLSNYNLTEFENKIFAYDFKSIIKEDFPIFGIQDFVEPETNVQFGGSQIFNSLSVKLFCVVKSETGKISGLLALGEKKSKGRFSIEDIDLLNIISTKLGETIERINLQDELFIEKIEKEKLEKLNELKSFFVSSVYHDLKTPLTSIKMFAELLKTSKNISDDKKEQYLNIIEGESNRLSRLIENVLNYAKIEKGIKVYNFEEIEINSVVKEVIHSMEYLLKMQHFTFQTKLYDGELYIYADHDSIADAIINLITNSMKFSPDKKNIFISIAKENNYAVVSVEDVGIGISEEDKKNLFKPFIQSKRLTMAQSTGAGIGLTIVKNIMDAHKGKIEFKSTLGIGSIFSLFFPITENTNE